MADVSTDPADFIYARALGQDAQTTADYVAQVVQVMGQEHIGSVLKHFPGLWQQCGYPHRHCRGPAAL